MLVLVKSILLGMVICFSLACHAGPSVDPDNTMVIKGVIQGDNLDALGKLLLRVDGEVNIVIDSPGGSVTTGSRFINYMESAKERGVTINCFVPNLAASMAFGILTHCSNRYALTQAFLLWHRARVMMGGIMGQPMTAPALLVLGRDLEALDQEILRETTNALGIDPEVVAYHFEAETLHLGINLHKIAPNFIEVHDSIPGLLEALHNDKLPHSKESNPFSFLFGEIIYISKRFSDEIY